MPTIAIIDGVRFVIYLKDHVPPHLHAFFDDCEAQISILTGEVLNGTLPRSKLKAVQRWVDANREQVAYVWSEIRAGRDPEGMIG